MTSNAPTSPFRLADLLDQADLGLELLFGDAEARERRVSGIHSVEVQRPARWLAPDWAMLTTGVRLVDDEWAQRELPHELAAAGVAALGFGCGVEFDTVPEPLIESAREIDFPIFAVPLRTPFREIEAFVQRALLSSETRELQRLASMQRYLVDALYAPDPRATIVRRLSTLLETSIAVLTVDGEAEEETGERPAGLAEVLDDPVSGVRRLDLDGWRVVATPVAPDPDDPDGRWLVAASRGQGKGHGVGNDRLTRAVLQAAAPLLAGVGRLDEGVRQQGHAVRGALLDDLMHGIGDESSLVARAAACGVDLRKPAAMLAFTLPWATAVENDSPVYFERQVDPRPDAPSHTEALTLRQRQVDERLGARGVDRLIGSDRGRVMALVTVGDAGVPDVWLDELTGDGSTTAGVGRSGIGAAAVVHGTADAHVAVERVDPEDGRRWRHYDEADLPALVVGQIDIERIGPQVDRVLAAIDSRPGLREALVMYLGHDQDVTAAAEALHLHPNSLRHRLNRLAEALGRPLRDPWTIATLVLVLEIERRGPAGR